MVAGRPGRQSMVQTRSLVTRRNFGAVIAAAAVLPRRAFAQPASSPLIRHIRTGVLGIAYEERGPGTGFPVLLLHGFPYDPRAFDAVAPALAAAGYRTITPWLRGYGETRFLS